MKDRTITFEFIKEKGMKRSLLLFFVMMFSFIQLLLSVEPDKWELRDFEEFLKGRFDGISVSYEGILSLSPKEDKIEGPAEEFYLSYLVASDGTAFLGTGHGGKIYRISKTGSIDLYFKVPEMDIYCLAQDSRGNLYAGTSPNGKIYKIRAKDSGNVFFNPPEKYIWNFLFTDNGSLLAAVGESGGIYEINRNGEGHLILKAEENHILCIMKSRRGDLIAGSGGEGRLYRISQNKKAFILFESPYEEIKTITQDEEGNIYAAAGGMIVKASRDAIAPISKKSETDVSITVTALQQELTPVSSLVPKQPSALYRIKPDGISKILWRSNEDLIYTVFWDNVRRRVIFGTGNRGRLYSVDSQDKISLLLQKNSEQIYSLIPHDSQVYSLSNNPSALSVLYSDQRFEGEYVSRVYDAKSLSSWGRITWEADVLSDALLQFQTRSGNSKEPNRTWSDWSPPYQKKRGEQILNPKARYIQFKAIFKTQSGRVSPHLKEVTLFYLQTNIAPEVTKLELLPPNEVFLKPPEQEEIIWGKEIDYSDESRKRTENKVYVMAKKVKRKGFRTLQWEANDPNGDSLLYSISLKRDNERKWRILKEKWIEKVFAFDTLSFPDGVYSVRVQASDSPSNPVEEELKTEKISRPIVIDNSIPMVSNFNAVRNDNKLTINFSTEDSFSYIKKVSILIRPHDWRFIFPIDGICDSMQETFELTLTLPPNFDNLITVKVEDSFGNIGIHRTTF